MRWFDILGVFSLGFVAGYAFYEIAARHARLDDITRARRRRTQPRNAP